MFESQNYKLSRSLNNEIIKLNKNIIQLKNKINKISQHPPFYSNYEFIFTQNLVDFNTNIHNHIKLYRTLEFTKISFDYVIIENPIPTSNKINNIKPIFCNSYFTDFEDWDSQSDVSTISTITNNTET